MKTSIKRTTSIILSMMLLATSVLFSSASVSADVTPAINNGVFSDEFTGSELGTAWKWVAANQSKDTYTAAVSNGKLGLYSDGGSLLTSMRYLDSVNYERVNQRVAVTFTAAATHKPVLWARFDAPSATAYGASGGYYATINYNTSGNGGEVVLSKRCDNYASGGGEIGKAGKIATITDGEKIKLEMTLTGASPTVINVYTYKIDNAGKETVVAHGTFVDNTDSLQDAGSVGISATANNGGTVELESFEYSSTDNADGNYYVEDISTTKGTTFGQWLTLDPTKTYIYAVDSKDNGTHAQGFEMVDPLWIEVRKNANGDYNRILTDRTKLSTNRDESTLSGSGVEHNAIYTLYYEFDLSAIATSDIYLDSNYSNMAQALVGFRLQEETYFSGIYTNFRIYEKGDANRTNLLVNPDFKMGLYGWCDNASGYADYTIGKEGDLKCTANNVEVKSATDTEFAETFKNNSYSAPVVNPDPEEPNAAFSDEFTGSALGADWEWVAANQSKDTYTAAVSNGKLGLYSDGGSLLTSMRYLDPADHSHINQRVAVTFTAAATHKPVLWARFNSSDANTYGKAGGYYAYINYNTSGNGVVEVYKRGENYVNAGIKLGTAGKGYFSDGQKLKLEMVVTGSSPTVISVYLYKINAETGAEAIVATSTFVDSEESLQDAGTVGISATSNNGGTVEIDSFEYSSTDNVTGNYYVSDNDTAGSKTFGQVVALDPTKEYVFAADATDNGTHSGGYELVNPLWVEHNSTQITNNDNRLVLSNSVLQHNRDKNTVGDLGITYGERYTVFTKFNLNTAVNPSIDGDTKTGTQGKVRVIVGFRLDNTTATAGNFTNFRLYAKDDAKRTNLLVNPDFKMGLYGWYDAIGAYNGYSVYKSGETTATNGNVTLHTATDYEFYTVFKNTGFVVDGDANKNQAFNVADLLHLKANKDTYGYYGAVDYNKDSKIDAEDLLYLRYTLLGKEITSPTTMLSLEAEKVLSAQNANVEIISNGDYTEDYT